MCRTCRRSAEPRNRPAADTEDMARSCTRNPAPNSPEMRRRRTRWMHGLTSVPHPTRVAMFTCLLRPGQVAADAAVTRAIRALLVTLLLCLGAWPTAAQSFTISGTITDAASGEALIGANVVAIDAEQGTSTNTYGFFSLTLARRDSVAVLFSYVGYAPQLRKLFVSENLELQITLEQSTGVLPEITVNAARERTADNVRRTNVGIVEVPIWSIQNLPAVLGEQDVLKVIQLLPGVQSGDEGTTGYHVRGGAVDQNLVLLDEATVYNPSHLFGLFSTFNPSTLNNIRLIKGGFPANYGGRLSSMLDISMREGNSQRHVVHGGIGLLSTQLTVEGPLKRDRASFIASARRTYFDVLAAPFVKGNNKNTYYFYDVNAKVNYRFSTRDRAYLSFFTGRDDADYTAPNALGYGVRFGNSTATLRWTHIVNPKLFSTTTLLRNEYFIRMNRKQDEFYSQNLSAIEDYTARSEFQYMPNPSHDVRVGGMITRHRFRSTGNAGNSGNSDPATGVELAKIPERLSTELAVYVNDRWEIGRRLGINAGVRLPYFSASSASYTYAEPRLSVRVGLADNASLKTSYTAMHQFVHLIPSTTASVPTDIWALSSQTIKPQRSQQVSLGYYMNMHNNEYEGSLEGYYKDMRNQVLFREGTQLLAYEAIEDHVTFGRGWSYGAELLVRRNTGRLTGWISYTLSWTEQRFSELNNGNSFPFKYDRRHNVALAASFELSDRWVLSGNFVYRTGSTYTLPTGRLFAAQGGQLYQGVYFDYERVNNYRLGPHHRLDVSASYKLKPKFFKEAHLVFGAYNVYSHLNPYFVYIANDTPSGLPESRQITLLPIVPSVSFEFQF